MRRPARPSSRKDRERGLRRHEIIRAARLVFAERGFTNATLDDIAERAEFGKGTLYNYFDSKEDLFAAVMNDLFDDVAAIAGEVSDGDHGLRETLFAFTVRVLAYYRENYTFCRLLMREWIRPESDQPERRMRQVQSRVQDVAAPLAQRVKAAIRAGEIKRGDAHVYATLFLGLVHHYYMHVASLDPPRTTRAINTHARLIVSLFLDGTGIPREDH